MATLTDNGGTWTVTYSGRKISVFSSLKWAMVFCENQGILVSDLASFQES